MERALITGGLGPRRVAHRGRAGRRRGRQVIVLDDLSRGRRSNLACGRGDGNVRVVEGDIRDRALVDRLTDGVDVVFHQAALRITRCAEEPQLALDVLASGTANVLEAAVQARRAQGRRRLVGVRLRHGRAASRRRRTTTRTPTTRVYGAAKAFNEGLLRSYHAMYGLDYVALRYFNVYGPRMDVHGVYTEVLVRWIERIAAGRPPLILGDGRQTMDFVHVADVARANLLAADVASVTRRGLQRRQRHGDQPRPARATRCST